MSTYSCLRRAICTFLIAASATTAAVAAYPDKPIKLVVPYPPGGTADILARMVAASMGPKLGVTVVVENRGGAGGNVAAQVVAKSPPDGYTLIFGNAPILAINPHLYKNVGFDPLKDFAPVTPVAEVPLFLITHPGAPFKSLPEMVSMAKKDPGRINYASGSNGSTTHLAMELFLSMAEVKIQHVPYKGSGPALVGLAGGEVPVMFELLPSAMPFVQGKRASVLAVTTAARQPAFPDVPTVAELGYPGYEVASWFGVLAPAGTPKEVVDTLHGAIVATTQVPDFRSRLAGLGASPMKGGPADFSRIVQTEYVKWKTVVKNSGATIE